MRGICGLLLPLLTFGASAAEAAVMVRESKGRVDVTAAAAPLADVLDRLARQTGMKIVYEGAAPRQLVTLSLVGRLPAEAVTAILEGQGLNYALILDASATRVETLLVTGAASGSSVSRPAPARAQPRFVAPEPEPEPEEDFPEPPPIPDPAALPTTEKAPQPGFPGSPVGPAGTPGTPIDPAGTPGTPTVPPGVVGVLPPGFPTPPPPPTIPGVTPVVVPVPVPAPTPPPDTPP